MSSSLPPFLCPPYEKVWYFKKCFGMIPSIDLPIFPIQWMIDCWQQAQGHEVVLNDQEEGHNKSGSGIGQVPQGVNVSRVLILI